MRQVIINEIKDSIATKQKVLSESLPILERIGEALADTLKNGGKILVCGNGGSAADSQHFAAELVGRFSQERDALPAIALTTDTSILTCIGNDYGYDMVFSRQVQALGQPGDALVAISTSGNSPNVLAAVEAAKDKGVKTICLTGKGGGKLGRHTDLPFIVPSSNTQRIQESHIMVIHILCTLIEEHLFPKVPKTEILA